MDTSLKRFGKHEAPTIGAIKSGRPKHARTEKKVTNVNELVSLQSQASQKQTVSSTRQISRMTGVTQCSIVLIIHRDLGLKCLSFSSTYTCWLLLLVFLTWIFRKVV